MAKAKAKSRKTSGIIDTVKDFFTPDSGTVADKLKNRDKDIAAGVAGDGAEKPKPKPKGGYKAGSNPAIKEGEDKLKKKSKAEIEAIRKRLKAGETVKAE